MKVSEHAGRVHVAYRLGHRDDYLRLFSGLFGLQPSVGMVGRRNLRPLLRAEALLFGTIDDDYAGFIVVALLRAALGRRTAGVFLRPQTCFGRKGLIYGAKRRIFAALKRVPGVSVFTIVPFSVAPDFAAVARDGLVDPQMWDLDTARIAPDPDLTRRITDEAAGRRVIAFIGSAHRSKGIDMLCDAISHPYWPRDRILAVIGGRIPDNQAPVVGALPPGAAMVLPRFLAEAELMALYAAADLVWACYRPEYDQASGIFGRAVQLSRLPVVRAGSLVARFARHFGLQTVELSDELPAAALLDPDPSAEAPNLAALRDLWRRDFIDRVRAAL